MNRVKSFEQEKILYLIATPIGNLQEFTERALNILKECDVVAAEDTRNAISLLSHFNLHKKTISLREHNEVTASKQIISLINEGKKVVYMSDAGYPSISDPGNILTKLAIEDEIAISTISGSSAFLNALVASGLETDHFFFYGFLSPKEKERKTTLESLKEFNHTLIFYESPHRIEDTLRSLFEVLGNRQIVIARELTKINEEYIRGTLEEVQSIDKSSIIGEIVILVEGNKHQEISDKSILDYMEYLKSKNINERTAIEITVDNLKVNKNRVKKLLIDKSK